MKKQFLLMVALFCAAFNNYSSGQATYTKVSGNDWNTPSNWSPQRTTPHVLDTIILPQDAVIHSSIPTQTIAKLIIPAGIFAPLEGSGGTLTVCVVDVAAGAILKIDNINLTLATGGSMTVNAGASLAISGGSTYNTNAAGAQTTVSGANAWVIIYEGTVLSSASSLFFGSGSRCYNYFPEATAIPTATWLPGSSLNINADGNNIPAGINQTFCNVVWSAYGQTADVSLNGTFPNITGQLYISETNGHYLSLYSGPTSNVTYSSGGLYIDGNNALFRFSDGAVSNCTWNMSGDYFSLGGNFLAGTSGNLDVHFTGSSDTAVSINATATNINWFVDANTELNISAQYSFQSFPVDTGNTLTVNGILSGGSSSSNGVSGGGNFVLNAGGTVRTWQSNGIYDLVWGGGTKTFSSQGNYEFYGANTGMFTTTPAANTVRILKFNRASGCILGQSLTVTNNLDLSSGVVTLGESSLVLSPGATITGSSSTAYLGTNSVGTLTRNVGSVPVAFPVGNSSYNPVTLTNNGVVDNFTVRVTNNALTGGTIGSSLTNPVVNRTWHISEATAGGSNVAMTLQWNAGEDMNNFDYNHVYIAHHTGTGWENGNINEHNAPAAMGVGPYTVARSGLTSFSPFAIGSDGASPLPICLEYFKATPFGTKNVLSWKLACSGDISLYNIERSSNGIDFSKIGALAGQADQALEFEDLSPLIGKNFYRLQLSDVSGVMGYSNVVMLNREQTGPDLQLYPNPARDKVMIIAVEAAPADIFGLDGRCLKTIQLEKGTNTIHVDRWAPGIYVVRVNEKSLRLQVE